MDLHIQKRRTCTHISCDSCQFAYSIYHIFGGECHWFDSFKNKQWFLEYWWKLGYLNIFSVAESIMTDKFHILIYLSLDYFNHTKLSEQTSGTIVITVLMYYGLWENIKTCTKSFVVICLKLLKYKTNKNLVNIRINCYDHTIEYCLEQNNNFTGNILGLKKFYFKFLV